MGAIEPDKVYTEREWDQKLYDDLFDMSKGPIQLPGEPV